MRNYATYTEAKEFARRLKIRTSTEWTDYIAGKLKKKIKRPNGIPSKPSKVYEYSGWISWREFIGPEHGKGIDLSLSHRKKCRPFKEASIFAQGLGLKSSVEWARYCKGEIKGKEKKPEDIPATARDVYRDEWKGWKSFLSGSEKKWKSYRNAKGFAQSLNLRTGKKWKIYCSKNDLPVDIPRVPSLVYKEKWEGWEKFLNKGGRWRSQHKAKQFTRSLGLRVIKDWKGFCTGRIPGLPERPLDIPTNPRLVYGEEWIGWDEWLGRKK